MKDTFRNDIGKILAAALKPLGFRKRGLTWQRTCDIFVDLIDIQAAQFDRSFTINLAVGIQDISNELFKPETTATYAADGIVEIRLGSLAHRKIGNWWSKDSPIDIQDAVEKLLQHGQTFFEKHHKTSEMIAILESEKHHIRLNFPKSYYLALLHIKYGVKQNGCKILNEIALRPTALWNEPSKALLQKYSCT